MRLTTYEPVEGGIPYVTVKDEQDALQKLAAYEDTGYSPLEIKSLEGEWNAMRKVVDSYRDAEEQGLIVRLPCKVGDTAYVIWASSIYPENPPAVREDHITQVKFTKKGYAFKTWRGWYHKSDIGKTVFLSREEAEAALKGLKGEAQ